MDTNPLNPALPAFVRYIPTVPFHNPVVLSLYNLLEPLQEKLAKPQAGVEICVQKLTHCSIRLYRAQGARTCRGAVLWIHGGGYIIGNAAMNDRECAAIAKELGVLVVSVDYRLGARNPFPAPLEDCYTAWQFMQSNASSLEIDRDRIVVIGQSAGGGLAACLAQRIAEAGGVQPVAQALIYPMLDDRTAANFELDAIKHRFWNNKNNRAGWHAYLGQPPGQPIAPRFAVAARHANLSGLPATWIGVGGLDLFYEENCAYAARLQAAGVSCELFREPGCPHGYDIIAPNTTVSQRLIQGYMTFIRDHLRPQP
ncbi:MAG: esterase [Pseudomonadales bacterium]|nr:esterase [Pseudomonadales bacterium]